MADFLWHKVSEKEKKEIKENAKLIMESFSEKLLKIDEQIPEFLIERSDMERSEGKGESCENDFRKIMFENAPQKSKDFIISERKEW